MKTKFASVCLKNKNDGHQFERKKTHSFVGWLEVNKKKWYNCIVLLFSIEFKVKHYLRNWKSLAFWQTLNLHIQVGSLNWKHEITAAQSQCIRRKDSVSGIIITREQLLVLCHWRWNKISINYLRDFWFECLHSACADVSRNVAS